MCTYISTWAKAIFRPQFWAILIRTPYTQRYTNQVRLQQWKNGRAAFEAPRILGSPLQIQSWKHTTCPTYDKLFSVTAFGQEGLESNISGSLVISLFQQQNGTDKFSLKYLQTLEIMKVESNFKHFVRRAALRKVIFYRRIVPGKKNWALFLFQWNDKLLEMLFSKESHKN